MKTVIIISLLLTPLLLLSQATEPDRHKEFLTLAQQYAGESEISLIVEEGIRAASFPSNDKRLHYFLQSNDYVQIYGYEGITNLAIVIDSEGKVVSVSIIHSADTPNFVRRIIRSGFLEQFAGNKDFEKVRIVTGATVTCETITETVSKTVALFAKWLTANGSNEGDK